MLFQIEGKKFQILISVGVGGTACGPSHSLHAINREILTFLSIN